MINDKIVFTELENKLKNYSKTITILSTDNDERFNKAKEILEKKFTNLKYLKIDKDFIENFDKNKKEKLLNHYFDLRKEKENEESLKNNFKNPNYFATLLLKSDFVDGIVSGSTHPTADILRPSFQILKTKDKTAPVSSFMWLSKKGKKDLFFADISVNPDPNFEELGKIAIQTANSVKKLFNIEPVIAMLSFSTLNSGGNHPLIEKIRKATEFVKSNSSYQVIGEIQWDAAFNEEIFKLKAKNFNLKKMPNVFIFPDLNNGNIGYKIAATLGNYLAIGPILQNIAKPVNDLSRGSNVDEIVNLVILTALQKIETTEEK
ncbi:MAG: putative phosphotransacetylase [Candidatus Hepatoplasma vulgare]|nr:MAG: putative phosphotransacetylase [Candidatus Hepatoplasma sp.]